MIPYSPSYHNAVSGMSPSATLHFNTTNTELIPMSVPLVLKPEVADYGGNALDQPVNNTCPAPNMTFKYVKEGGADSETTEVDATTAGPILVIVMGASESEKLILGTALASALGLPFTDADALHTGSSIEKMNADVPDWQAWLENVKKSAVDMCEKQAHESAAEEGKNKGDTGPGAQGVVVGFSTLKKKYRDVLRDLLHRPRIDYCKCSRGDGTCPESCPCCRGINRKEKAHLRMFFVNNKNMLQRMKYQTDHINVNIPEVEEEEGEEGIVVVPLGVGVEEQVRIAKKGLQELGALRSE